MQVDVACMWVIPEVATEKVEKRYAGRMRPATSSSTPQEVCTRDFRNMRDAPALRAHLRKPMLCGPV